MKKSSVEKIVESMWRRMHYRCNNDPAYKNIEVRMTKLPFILWATRAVENFQFFYPDAKPSIDRIDYDGHYEIGNIRIADTLVNRITSRFVSRYLNISDESASRRLHITKILVLTLCKQLNISKVALVGEISDCTKTDFFV